MARLFTRTDLERCARLAFRLHGIESDGAESCIARAVQDITAESPEYLTREQWEHQAT